jgi:hypothetical protein
MKIYPVDIEPEQIVRWIRAEQKAVPSAFVITARRRSEVREIPVRKETHLGDEEREDLSEIATIATLEIAPADVSDGWLLTITIEDEVGPRLPKGAMATAGEQQIDLGTFCKEFIRPGRGNANVIAEVTDPAAKARLTRLLNAIERNRHGVNGGASGGC